MLIYNVKRKKVDRSFVRTPSSSDHNCCCAPIVLELHAQENKEICVQNVILMISFSYRYNELRTIVIYLFTKIKHKNKTKRYVRFCVIFALFLRVCSARKQE